LHTFGLLHQTHEFEPWHFTYVVWFRGVRIFIGRPKALEGRYITLEARFPGVLPEHQASYDVLDAQVKAQFYSALALETAKARIAFIWRNISDISVSKYIPITDRVSESEIIESLNEIQMSVAVIWNTTTLWLAPATADLTQVSLAEDAVTPAALPQSPPNEANKGKKQ
jgi:hypothetical protein